MAARMTKTDVAIIGGGFVGLSLGLALAQGGMEVVVVDPVPPPETLEPAFDGRASAIARSGWNLFAVLGLGPDLDGKAQDINQIMVAGADLDRGAGPLFLHFDHAQTGGPMSRMIENRHLRFALYQAVARQPRLRLLAPDAAVSVTPSGSGVRLGLQSGESLECALCVAADGRDSPLRAQFGVRVTGWSYEQTGIVATVRHARPHGGVAYELFLPSGPFAILPLPGDRSSIVWTERTASAAAYLDLPPEGFAAEVAKRFGDQWGPIAIEGPRWSYPLRTHLAGSYVAARFALAGDAAHAIHPIAGQGLNLGLRDVAALAETVIDAARLGLDIGAGTVLERYQRWRRFDGLAMAAACDGLNRLFSNDIAPLKAVRNLGLGAVNSVGPLRRFFMRQAGGEMGDAPKLLRGEAI
jgi:2-octaprenyl-6-methoxyphenol hydroxylase